MFYSYIFIADGTNLQKWKGAVVYPDEETEMTPEAEMSCDDGDTSVTTITAVSASNSTPGIGRDLDFTKFNGYTEGNEVKIIFFSLFIQKCLK